MVDGDGCIAIARDRRKMGKAARNYFYYRTSVRVTQAEYGMSLLLWLKDVFGGHITICHHRGGKYTRATYNWFVRDSYAKELLIGISPYLILKKAQAQLGLEFLESKGNAKSSRRESNLAVFQAQEVLFGTMHEINQHRKML